MKSNKSKALSIRVTDSQRERIKQLAEENNMTISTYALHRMLENNTGIYTQEFFNCVHRINAIYLDANTNDPATAEVLSELKKEVHQLWQYLK